jgi:DNA-binding NtrC family response regulator
MREGAADFLVKPLDLHRLRGVVDRVFEDRRARRARKPGPTVKETTPDVADGTPGEQTGVRLIGHHSEMVEVFKAIGQVAATRATVVIRGESGTGKELVARAIHDASPYAELPFVPVNCTALPTTLLESELFGHVRGSFTGAHRDRRGRFAMAGTGTIFLDEIGDTTPEFQGKLLRVLQEHEYYPVGAELPEKTGARVITATHQDLEEMVGQGEFRQDLYYRLRVVEIHVPPLRDRRSDIPALAEHLAARAGVALGRRPPVIAKESLEALTSYDWPGNVRELENCLTRAAVMAARDVIRLEHLALGEPVHRMSEHRLTSLDEMERDHLAHVLQATGGNKSRAARILGISRPRLSRMIQRLGLAGRSSRRRQTRRVLESCPRGRPPAPVDLSPNPILADRPARCRPAARPDGLVAHSQCDPLGRGAPHGSTRGIG